MAFYSDKLKQLRKEKGLTQRELAEKLGLGKSAIGMYESGKRTPEFETLEMICDFFNVNMDLLSDVKSTSTPAPAPKEESPLSAHEKAMVDAYKKASDKDKYTVDMVLNEYSDEDLPALAEKEKGTDLNDSTAV